VVIDGVFFQLNSTGIARVWHSVLERWAMQPFAHEVLVLDRVGTAPRFPGLRYLDIPRYVIGQGDDDRDMLQHLVDQHQGELFASTYYTSVRHTKTLQIVYDMIPEVMGWNVTTEPAWIEKHYAFKRAAHYVCISENTRRDLLRYFPMLAPHTSQVVPLGVDTHDFAPPSSTEVLEFHQRYSLTKPYFLLVGSGDGIKNASMLLEALRLLPSQHGFEVVMVTRGSISATFLDWIRNGTLKVLPLSDEELRIAYASAIAFVYPSLYEGFGLPILESMACNCPVISNDKASLPEVGGSAVLYAGDAVQLASALCDVQKPEVQRSLIAAGRERIKAFTWERTAREWWSTVCALTADESMRAPEFSDVKNSRTAINPA
jgi:glycosyltransferase involved in cell wall biosynthesis